MMKGLMVLAAVCLFSTPSCKTKKDVSNEKEEVQENVEKLRVVDSTWEIPEDNTPTGIDTAYIEGDILTLQISYSGGCEEHSFELLTRKMYKKSMPPQLDLYLFHQSNGDACRKLINQTLEFDISEAKYPGGNPREVRLSIGSGTKGMYRLPYKYK